MTQPTKELRMLNIDEFNDAVGTYDLTILDKEGEAHVVTLSYRRPDHFGMLDAEYRSGDLSGHMREYFARLDAWREAFEARYGKAPDDLTVEERKTGAFDFSDRPTLTVPSDAFDPRLRFIAQHITGADGLATAEGPVEWSSLRVEQQIAILRRGGSSVAWDLYRAITDSAKLKVDVKND